MKTAKISWRTFPLFSALFLLGLALVLYLVGREAALVATMTETPDGDFRIMLYLLMQYKSTWLDGVKSTFLISVLGTAIGFVLAVLLSYLRLNEPSRRDSHLIQFIKYLFVRLEKLYVTVLRGTPMMVQACIVYYAGFSAVRAMMPTASITEVNRIWSLFTAAAITLSLNSAAYLSEILRGGIEAMDKGQSEACRALGLTRWQGMTRIIYPQAIRAGLPAIINEFINNIKGTSVLTVIGFGELMFATTSISGKTYQYLPAYLVAALLYLLLVILLSYGLNLLVDFIFWQGRFKKARRMSNA